MPGCGLGEKTPVRFGWREEEDPMKSLGNGGFFVRSNLLQCGLYVASIIAGDVFINLIFLNFVFIKLICVKQ